MEKIKWKVYTEKCGVKLWPKINSTWNETLQILTKTKKHAITHGWYNDSKQMENAYLKSNQNDSSDSEWLVSLLYLEYSLLGFRARRNYHRLGEFLQLMLGKLGECTETRLYRPDARTVIVYLSILLLLMLLSSLHYVWVADDAIRLLVTWVCLCVCVCLSLATLPHYCMDPDVTRRNGRGCPLVVHYWADLQSVHGFHCYDNIARTWNVSTCTCCVPGLTIPELLCSR